MNSVQRYMGLPWTIRTEERHDDGDYLVARVEELPGLVATGETRDELEAALWEALEDHIRSYLESGEPVPIPEGSEAAVALPSADRIFVRSQPDLESAGTVRTQEKEAESTRGEIRDRELEPLAG